MQETNSEQARFGEKDDRAGNAQTSEIWLYIYDISGTSG